MKAEDNEFPYVLFDEQGSDPSTPAAGFWRAYMKAGGLYVIDDGGTVVGPMGPTGAVTFAGCRVGHSVAQNLNNGSVTQLDFDTEIYDTDGFHAGGTPSRLTIPSGLDGYYEVYASSGITASTNGSFRAIRILLNGVLQNQVVVGDSASADLIYLNGRTGPLSLVSTDYLTCEVYVNGASLQALASSPVTPYFGLYRVGV